MEPATLLRATYRVNAIASLACGVVLLAAGHWLAVPLGIPAAALRATGAFFAAFAAWVWMISRRRPLLRREAAIVGGLDAAYAVASVLALAAFGEQVTPLSRIAIAVAAAPVAVFAAVELRAGFPRERPPATA